MSDDLKLFLLYLGARLTLCRGGLTGRDFGHAILWAVICTAVIGRGPARFRMGLFEQLCGTNVLQNQRRRPPAYTEAQLVALVRDLFVHFDPVAGQDQSPADLTIRVEPLT